MLLFFNKNILKSCVRCANIYIEVTIFGDMEVFYEILWSEVNGEYT